DGQRFDFAPDDAHNADAIPRLRRRLEGQPVNSLEIDLARDVAWIQIAEVLGAARAAGVRAWRCYLGARDMGPLAFSNAAADLHVSDVYLAEATAERMSVKHLVALGPRSANVVELDLDEGFSAAALPPVLGRLEGHAVSPSWHHTPY